MNPFDDDDATFLVLRNAEEQHSLWPSFLAIPDGWDVDLPESTRSEALGYIERAWPDILPLSVRKRLGRTEAHPTDGTAGGAA